MRKIMLAAVMAGMAVTNTMTKSVFFLLIAAFSANVYAFDIEGVKAADIKTMDAIALPAPVPAAVKSQAKEVREFQLDYQGGHWSIFPNTNPPGTRLTIDVEVGDVVRLELVNSSGWNMDAAQFYVNGLAATVNGKPQKVIDIYLPDFGNRAIVEFTAKEEGMHVINGGSHTGLILIRKNILKSGAMVSELNVNGCWSAEVPAVAAALKTPGKFCIDAMHVDYGSAEPSLIVEGVPFKGKFPVTLLPLGTGKFQALTSLFAVNWGFDGQCNTRDSVYITMKYIVEADGAIQTFPAISAEYTSTPDECHIEPTTTVINYAFRGNNSR